MSGAYPNYEEYDTAIAVLDDGANAPPVAEPRSEAVPAPLWCASTARSPRTRMARSRARQWDFGDGATGHGAGGTHTYAAGGRYFPRLTVTDNEGATSTFVEEITGRPAAAPGPHRRRDAAHGSRRGGPREPADDLVRSSTDRRGVRGGYDRAVAARRTEALHQVEAQLPRPRGGAGSTTTGSWRQRVRHARRGPRVRGRRPPGSDAYRDAVLATPRLASYWRLGELSGDSRGTSPARRPWDRSPVATCRGQPGVLGPLGNTAAGFDGLSGECRLAGP